MNTQFVRVVSTCGRVIHDVIEAERGIRSARRNELEWGERLRVVPVVITEAGLPDLPFDPPTAAEIAELREIRERGFVPGMLFYDDGDIPNEPKPEGRACVICDRWVTEAQLAAAVGRFEGWLVELNEAEDFERLAGLIERLSCGKEPDGEAKALAAVEILGASVAATD